MSVGTTARVVAMAVLLLVIGTLLWRGAPPSWETANRVVDDWLAAMAKPTGDRGWSRLSSETQEALYGGDPRAYWADLDQVDWSAVAWEPANGHVDDGRFYLGQVWLRSHPSTLPDVLVDRGLAAASCVDEAPFGIHVQMRLGWFTDPGIVGLPWADGPPDPCRVAFDGAGGVPHGPYDLVGGAWGNPGPIQRVGVLDVSGLVTSISWGRENPPLEGSVAVDAFGPRELAVTWRGASCDSNSTIVVEGSTDALRISVQRGRSRDCSGDDVVYDSIVAFGVEVDEAAVKVSLATRP